MAKTPPTEWTAEAISDDVRMGLARLYKLRLWQWGTWLALLPVMAIVASIHPPEWVFMSFGILGFGAWIVISLVHAFFRCPACRHFFNWRLLYGNPFTSKCLHCRISIADRMRGV